MEYHLLSDKQLVEECSQDNIKAFNILFERYSSRIYTYALTYVKDEYIAEEVMMDLLYWIWEKRHSLEIRGDFKPYIFRAAKNAIIKSIRRKAVSGLPVEYLENHPACISLSADHDLLSRELETGYQNRLKQLSPQRKTVFHLSREENLSHAEIATQLDISINTVKNHIKFSLNHFRENLSGYTDILLLISSTCMLLLKK